MKKSLLVVAVLAMCAVVQAGLNLTCTFDNDPQVLYHDYEFTADADNMGGQLDLYETYTVAYPATDAVNMHLTADNDPYIRVTKYVTNDNGHDWTGYTLTLSDCTIGSNIVFVAPASGVDPDTGATIFSTVSVTDNLITFSDGIVEVGQEVALNFKIWVPTAGNFSWCVTQQAIPEPATIGILGLGALALFRRK